MESGYIKLFRRFLNWEWYDDINTSRLFLHLLLTANHKEKQWRGVTINKGQVLVGRKNLSIETGLSEQQIRTSISRLKSTNEITTKSTNKYTLVTIVNWEKYQDNEKIPTNKNTDEQTTSNQQITTNKNEKNVKNNKKYIYTQMFEEFWCKYPKKRNKAKCKEWYLKHQPSEELHKEILWAITFYSADEQWKKDNGQFIPYPTTFLNQKRWEDFKNE